MTPQQIIHRLSVNPWFGCLTRNAMDLRLESLDWRNKAIVYFDIDNLKLANERWGKAEASRRIAEALRFRAQDIGCWFSGDEFVAVVPTIDAIGLAQRVMAGLRAQQMSATFVVLTGSRDVDRAEQLVSQAKRTTGKGRIYIA